jgi:hypothetical protein
LAIGWLAGGRLLAVATDPQGGPPTAAHAVDTRERPYHPVVDELLEAPRASGERARRRTWPLAAVLVLGLGAATLVAAHDATSTSAPGPCPAGSNRSGAPPAQSLPVAAGLDAPIGAGPCP